ncbi:MAG: malonate-semialdehyde dehydrogenase (acetylating) / methylmalonate-semialdehyde dehydrogenase, partial [Bryobacterales bacterium]|nr:malonate-semialdehyde dehydrogenase (acetylating) / methylmalonate-semialdehyde dehydrogenase [Bryobacterales bacterium]
MFRFRDLADTNRHRIAELISLEHGKTLPDAAGEVARGIENIEFACGVP